MSGIERSLPNGDRDDWEEKGSCHEEQATREQNMQKQIRDRNADLLEFAYIVSPRAVWLNADIHGWHEPPATLQEDLLLIHSEVSEAVEAARNGLLHMTDGSDSVAEELADVIIRVFHTAAKNKIDIVEAVRAKHKKNMGRPYRHGNKVF